MSETARERAFRAWRESDWDDVAIFLGPNADRFRSAWQKTHEKMADGRPTVAWTWCWPALVLGFAWFLYRKQWMVGAILLLLPLAFAFFLELPSSGGLGVAVVIAATAKSLVVQDAVSRIAKIKDTGGGRGELARAGGVSIAGAVVGGGILLLAVAGMVLSFGGDASL